MAADSEHNGGSELLDTLDPAYPLSEMTIPKLQDVQNMEVAKQVDDLLGIDKQLQQEMRKSTTYRLFGKNDNKNLKLKDQYMDILAQQCESIFPEELLVLHFQSKPNAPRHRLRC